MAQQSIGLFGLKVVPGEEHELEAFGDVRITNIAFGETIQGKGRTVVKVHHRPVPSFDDDSDEDDDEDEDEDEDDDDEEEDEENDDEEAASLKEKVKGGKDVDEEDDEEVEQTFVVCSLYPGQIEQVTVDLHFSIEDDVRFSVTGDNPVEIMGSFLSPGRFDEDPDSDELYDSDDEYDEEIDSDEMELLEAMNGGDDDEVDDDSDDIELDMDDEDDDTDDDEGRILEFEAEDDEDEEDDDEDEDDEADEAPDAKAAVVNSIAVNGKKRSAADADISHDNEEVTEAELAKVAKEMGLDVSKLSKNQRKKLNKRLRGEGDVSGNTSAEVQKEAVQVVQKDAAADGKVKTQKAAAAKEVAKKDGKPVSKKVTLPSGVIVEDIKLGSGPQAKAGNRLGMRYVGRLKTGKQFDANTKGKPFTFKLGKGEVIGGWDEGLKGMQVGGERRLVIPPKMGYGARGAPPDIPGNSTLIFDVKLVEIK